MAEKLREAAARGEIAQVTRLLDEKVKLLADENGRGPLLLAAANGHVDLCQVLLLHEADVSAVDDHGNCALHEASWRGYSRTVAILAKALGTQRAPLHARNLAGFAPLHLACQNGHNQSCRELLLAGSNPDLQNNYGDTPLHTSARYGHAGVTRILISALCRVSDQNKNGDTALHIAAAMGRRKLTRILLEAGCERSLRNKQGETAKDIARRKNLLEILEIICKARGKNRTRSKSREDDSVDAGKITKSEKKRDNVANAAIIGLNKDRKKHKCRSKQHKVRFEKAIMERQWSPYGCHYYPDPEAFPQPRLDSLPADPLGRGEQYYLDLAGNIRKGPVGVGYTCYCAPFFRHMEAKLERDKAELKAHIDQAHERLDLKVANLERRTRGQICELTKCVQEERSLLRGGRGRCSERAPPPPAKRSEYRQRHSSDGGAVVLPTRTRSLEDLLDDSVPPQDRSFEIPGETAVHRGSLDDLDIPAIPRLSTSMRDLPSWSGMARSGALRVLDIPSGFNGITVTESPAAVAADSGCSVFASAILKDPSDDDKTVRTAIDHADQMMERFQRVPDIYNGWRGIRSGSSEPANLNERTNAPPSFHGQSVARPANGLALQGSDEEGSEGEEDDDDDDDDDDDGEAKQPEAYKAANRRKAHHDDTLARMPYRSRNAVYSPLPPLHDAHNDSGYSTRMYGSSKGASPSLSGQLECDVVVLPGLKASFPHVEQLAALLERPRGHDRTIYERSADNALVIGIGTASLV